MRFGVITLFFPELRVDVFLVAIFPLHQIQNQRVYNYLPNAIKGSDEQIFDDPVDYRPGVALFLGGLCQRVEDALPLVADFLELLQLLFLDFGHQVDVLVVDLVVHEEGEVFQLGEHGGHVERLHALDHHFCEVLVELEDLQDGFAEVETRLCAVLLVELGEVAQTSLDFAFSSDLESEVYQTSLGKKIEKIYEFFVVEEVDFIGEFYVDLFEVVAVAGNGLEYFCLFLPELFERYRSNLGADVIDFHALRLDIIMEGEIQFLQLSEGERGFEMKRGPVFDGQPPAVLEVVNERFVELGLAEVVLVDLDVDVMVLQVFGVELLARPKGRIDLAQLQRLLPRYEDLLLLVIEARFEQFLFENLLRVLGPLEAIEMADDFCLDFFLLLDAFLCRLELDILEDSAQFVTRLSVPQEVLHLLDVVLDLPALLLFLQLLHPPPRDRLDPPQLHQVLLHLRYFFHYFQVVERRLTFQFIEVIGDVFGEEGDDVGVVVHVVAVSDAGSIALRADQLFSTAFGLDAVVALLPHLALRAGLAAPLDDRQHLVQPKVAQQI